MGNRITHRATTGDGGAGAGSGLEGNSQFNTRRRYQQHKREYCIQDEYRSKTLPARYPQNETDTKQSQQSHLGSSSCLGSGSGNGANATSNSGETSRMLFLLYLIHRTWNVVMDTMDSRTKSRSRREESPQPKKEPQNDTLHGRRAHPMPDEECSIDITDIDIDASSYCSQYSCCSCSYCYEEAVDNRTNVYSSVADEYSLDSIYDQGKSICAR
ncbi:hypothetical protein ACLKA7_016269 [Drosophila subpalustris]